MFVPENSLSKEGLFFAGQKELRRDAAALLQSFLKLLTIKESKFERISL